MMKHDFTPLFCIFLLMSCQSGGSYDATGTFEAETVTVSAEVQGAILSFEVGEGDTISAGETLCRIDSTALVLQRGTLVAQQKAQLSGRPDVARQLSASKEQISKQEKEVQRMRALVADDAAPSKQLDDAEDALALLRRQYDAALSSLTTSTSSIEANVAVLATQIDLVEHSISQCTPAAPISGRVLSCYLRPGELVTPGRPLVKLADMDQMYLRAYFTSDQLPYINVGQQVKVWADFGGNERYPYPGTVCWIASESEFTPKNIQTRNSRANLVYAAKIAVKNDGRLKIGVYGEVEL